VFREIIFEGNVEEEYAPIGGKSMACIFALFATLTPRLALLLLWIFTPLVNRAFSFFLWPLLGLILLPFTTMIYVLVYVPHIGVVGWNWLWIILGFFLDLAAYAGSGYSNRNRFPAMSRYPS